MTGQHKDTFFSRAQADAELTSQGRFKKETATRVTGVPTYPSMPASSPWSNDPVPPEEPLGFSVDELPPNLGGQSNSPSSSTAPPSQVEQGEGGIFSPQEANEK
jgi:hypothetical protein